MKKLLIPAALVLATAQLTAMDDSEAGEGAGNFRKENHTGLRKGPKQNKRRCFDGEAQTQQPSAQGFPFAYNGN